MSKSLGDKHFIGLFEDAVSVREKVKTAVTDSGEAPAGLDISPGVENLFQLLAAAGRKDLVADFTDLYRKRQLKYGLLKDEVVTALMAILAPIAERRALIREDYVLEITYEGSRIARRQAIETLAQAREAAGLLHRNLRRG
jgi:tryptophanyl-tRNA synthetase